MLPHLRMNDVPLFGKGYFFDQSSGEMINIVPTSLGSIYSRSTFFKCFFNLFDFFIRKEGQNYLSSILQFLQLVHYFFSSLVIGSVLSRADICFVRDSTQSRINCTSLICWQFTIRFFLISIFTPFNFLLLLDKANFKLTIEPIL